MRIGEGLSSGHLLWTHLGLAKERNPAKPRAHSKGLGVAHVAISLPKLDIVLEQADAKGLVGVESHGCKMRSPKDPITL